MLGDLCDTDHLEEAEQSGGFPQLHETKHFEPSGGIFAFSRRGQTWQAEQICRDEKEVGQEPRRQIVQSDAAVVEHKFAMPVETPPEGQSDVQTPVYDGQICHRAKQIVAVHGDIPGEQIRHHGQVVNQDRDPHGVKEDVRRTARVAHALHPRQMTVTHNLDIHIPSARSAGDAFFQPATAVALLESQPVTDLHHLRPAIGQGRCHEAVRIMAQVVLDDFLGRLGHRRPQE
mmetsp:Transcript_46264/g.116397  ORF Transcript_46264/g.116397 Transcript_46264/m.116397 type:complete len:231 (-) Transcript_46264:401-1093(-)